MGKTNDEWTEILSKLERDEWPDVVDEIRRDGMERAAKEVRALLAEGLWDEDTLDRVGDAIRDAAKELP